MILEYMKVRPRARSFLYATNTCYSKNLSSTLYLQRIRNFMRLISIIKGKPRYLPILSTCWISNVLEIDFLKDTVTLWCKRPFSISSVPPKEFIVFSISLMSVLGKMKTLITFLETTLFNKLILLRARRLYHNQESSFLLLRDSCPPLMLHRLDIIEMIYLCPRTHFAYLYHVQLYSQGNLK